MQAYTDISAYVAVTISSPYDEIDPDVVRALKLKFAEAYARNPTNPIEAARTIEANPARAMYVADNWPLDKEVVDHMEAVALKKGAAGMLPTKEEFALKILGQAEECAHKATRLDYLKLAADVMGFLPKGGAINVNAVANAKTAVQTNVYVMPPMADPNKADWKDWQAGALEQQRKLIADAAN